MGELWELELQVAWELGPQVLWELDLQVAWKLGHQVVLAQDHQVAWKLDQQIAQGVAQPIAWGQPRYQQPHQMRALHQSRLPLVQQQARRLQELDLPPRLASWAQEAALQAAWEQVPQLCRPCPQLQDYVALHFLRMACRQQWGVLPQPAQ